MPSNATSGGLDKSGVVFAVLAIGLTISLVVYPWRGGSRGPAQARLALSKWLDAVGLPKIGEWDRFAIEPRSKGAYYQAFLVSRKSTSEFTIDGKSWRVIHAAVATHLPNLRFEMARNANLREYVAELAVRVGFPATSKIEVAEIKFTGTTVPDARGTHFRVSVQAPVPVRWEYVGANFTLSPDNWQVLFWEAVVRH